LVPNTELAQLMGCQTSGGAIRVDDQQSTSVAGIWAAGECTSVKGEEAAMTEGEIAARAAVGDRAGAMNAKLQRRRNAGRAFGALLGSAFAPRAELLALVDDETIVCRCEDVRRGALNPAWSQRQAKPWTRLGMGACQGAVCGPACTTLFGWERNTVRPPLGTPVLGAWAGDDEG
jgi:NAD(P)H-nitrite reductase large subunit